MGASIVFMIIYVWSREFPNERLNIHDLFQLKVCHPFTLVIILKSFHDSRDNLKLYFQLEHRICSNFIQYLRGKKSSFPFLQLIWFLMACD